MLRQTAHPTEPRYEVLALFTASMVAASFVVVAIGTLLPFIAQAFPAERDHVSLLVTSLLLGAAISNAFTGAATDRFGDKTMLLACGLVMGLSLIASGIIPSFAWIAGCFLVYGMAYSAINPVGSHAILFFFKPQERGVAMGVRQMGLPLGGVLGAIVFSICAQYWGYRGALMAGGVIVIAVTLTAFALYREPPELYGKPVKAGVLLRDMLHIGSEPRLLLITAACVILFASQVALMAFFPWTLVSVAHTSPDLASLVFVITQFSAAAARLLWGWASDKLFHGRRMPGIAITCVLSAIAAVCVANVGGMPIAVVAGIAVLLGFAAEGWFGLAIVAMAEVGGEEHAGSALGFGLTWVYITGVFTPAIFALLMQRFSIPAAWHVIAAISLVGLAPSCAAIALTNRRLAAASS